LKFGYQNIVCISYLPFFYLHLISVDSL
jgi:hypothetical protein